MLHEINAVIIHYINVVVEPSVSHNFTPLLQYFLDCSSVSLVFLANSVLIHLFHSAKNERTLPLFFFTDSAYHNGEEKVSYE